MQNLGRGGLCVHAAGISLGNCARALVCSGNRNLVKILGNGEVTKKTVCVDHDTGANAIFT
jgi:ribosomal protein L15